MKILPRLASLLTFLLVSAAPTLARSPEETLVAFVAAVKQEGLTASVRFIHPAELAAFRAEFEPEIAKRVRNGRTREQFVSFTDPYHPKQIRPFKDDADFVAVFIKWLSTSGLAGITTFDHATVQPLGAVAENDLRHVVARFVYSQEKKSGDNAPAPVSTREIVTVTTMKMDAGQPLLLLLPELKNFANLVRQGR